MSAYLAYARVSTPRQGEKGVSLPEQKDAIERYAKLHGLEITRWFEERESASHQGRPVFSEMLRLLQRRSDLGVIIHKIDRSVRNIEDWSDICRLLDAGVEVHSATENLDLRTVAGRLSGDLLAVFATHFSRNLREEVKKGIYGRLKQGYYPFGAWCPCHSYYVCEAWPGIQKASAPPNTKCSLGFAHFSDNPADYEPAHVPHLASRLNLEVKALTKR
jgi:DNA invertase Pin-like site-specific DNA recombinase